MDNEPEEDIGPNDDPPDIVDRILEKAAAISALYVQQLSWVAALEQNTVTAATGRGGLVNREIVERSVRLELASALRVTEHKAGIILGLADALFYRYPVIRGPVERAEITTDHAEALIAGVDGVRTEYREQILREGLALALAHPVGVFRRKLRRLIETVQADTLTQRHERALESRRVVLETEGDGMGWLHWYGPAVEAHAIHTRVTAIAKGIRAAEGESRTLDQVRSDVFADLLIDGECDAHPDEVRGIRATVVVTVPVLALVSDDPEVLADCDPAVVEGIGPIPLARARELAGGASGWTRVLTHPETGMVLSVGRDQYRPPPSLVRLVKWRADRCMTPGCGMPASRCQIDHTIAWEHNGPTSLGNLSPLCQGHHTVKHHGGWTVRQVEGSGGAIEWVSPTGRRYLVKPERRVPVFRTSSPEPERGRTSAPF